MNHSLKKKMLDLARLPAEKQMQTEQNKEIIYILGQYLKECENMDDLDLLNNKGDSGLGLWFGDVRIIAMIGATGTRILNTKELIEKLNANF